MKVIARKLLPKVDNKDIYKLNFMILSKILIIINIGDVNYLINSRLFGHNCKVKITLLTLAYLAIIAKLGIRKTFFIG